MAYGVDFHEFWDTNPRILRIYADAYREKRKLLDEQFWSMGQYVFIGTYVAIGKMFGGEKFKERYPDRPFTWPQRTQEEIDAEQLDWEIQKAIRAEEAYIRQEKLAGLPESI